MRMTREDRRSHIVNAALQVASREGFSEVTIRDVAREADISLGVVHYCFEDKLELQQEMSVKLVNDVIDFYVANLIRKPTRDGLEGFREDFYERTLEVMEEFLPARNYSVLFFEVMINSFREHDPSSTTKSAGHFFEALDNMINRVYISAAENYHLNWIVEPEKFVPIITDACLGMVFRILSVGQTIAENGQRRLSTEQRAYVENLVRAIIDLSCLYLEEKR